MVKGLTTKDELFYVEISDNEISDIRYLKVMNSKKCLTAKFTNYSSFKYFFTVEENELIDIDFISIKEFQEKFKNYDLEIIRYKKENEDYWKDYERTKRDYNWKYEIAKGINPNWVKMKKKFLDEFLEEIKDVQQKQKDNIDKSETLKMLNKNCDEMLECMTQKMSCHSEFIRPGASGTMNISLHRSTAFFDTMLKEYYKLFNKYSKKPDHNVYLVLLDFQKIIKKNKNLNYMERKIVNQIMENGFSYEGIETFLNINFKRKNKPYNISNVKQLVDYIIPNKIFKEYDNMCREKAKNE